MGFRVFSSATEASYSGANLEPYASLQSAELGGAHLTGA